MTLDDLHQFLTSEFGLVPDAVERGSARSYFWQQVNWHPASSTRVLRVHHEPTGLVSRIQLCVSSDNNNSVFLLPPFSRESLHTPIVRETELRRAALARISCR